MVRALCVLLVILGTASVVAGDDAASYKPGAKVIVRLRDEETVGEFIERMASGDLLILVRPDATRDVKMLYRPAQVRLAPPGATFGLPPGAAPPAAPTVPEEIRPLLGTWRITRWEQDGETLESPPPLNVKFTPTRYYFGIASFPWYRVDPQASPAQLDVGVGPNEPFDAAIYALNGDELKLCLCLEENKPRPRDFATKAGDGLRYVVCRRLPNLSNVLERPIDEAHPDLATRLDECAAVLRERGFPAFVNECVAPEQRTLPALQDEAALRRRTPAEIEAVAAVLAAARHLTPEVDDTGTRAVYEIDDWSDDLESNGGALTMLKVDGKWYMSAR